MFCLASVIDDKEYYILIPRYSFINAVTIADVL